MLFFEVVLILSLTIFTSAQLSIKCGITSKPTDENATLGEFFDESQKAAIGEYPWYAGIYDKSSKNILICGATIISPYVLLSAAHCFYDRAHNNARNVTNYEIAVSTITHNYYNKDADTTKFYQLEKIILNNFKGLTLRYQKDIAILVTKDKIDFNYAVSPVCLPPENVSIVSGSVLKIPIWKSNQSDPHITTSELKRGYTQYLDFDECSEKNLPSIREFLALDKFCASHDGSLGLRNGGNGFTYQSTNESPNYLVGVASIRTVNTGEDANYLICTDVKFYLSWIKKTGDEIHKNKNLNYSL